MSYSGASAQQIQQVSAHVVQMRALIGQFAKLMGQFANLDAAWQANVSQIIGSPASPGTAVTDSSALAGIVPLTDYQIATFMTQIEALLATYNTLAARQEYVLACGATNMA